MNPYSGKLFLTNRNLRIIYVRQKSKPETESFRLKKNQGQIWVYSVKYG
jgi:hypothetical protein